MSSIARRINMSFWLKELGNVILIDIVIAFLIVSVFAVWGRKQLPQGVGGMRYYVEKNEDGGAYEYIIEGSDEKKYVINMDDTFCCWFSTESLSLQ